MVGVVEGSALRVIILPLCEGEELRWNPAIPSIPLLLRLIAMERMLAEPLVGGWGGGRRKGVGGG